MTIIYSQFEKVAFWVLTRHKVRGMLMSFKFGCENHNTAPSGAD
jgi:hypothetical protein